MKLSRTKLVYPKFSDYFRKAYGFAKLWHSPPRHREQKMNALANLWKMSRTWLSITWTLARRWDALRKNPVLGIPLAFENGIILWRMSDAGKSCLYRYLVLVTRGRSKLIESQSPNAVITVIGEPITVRDRDASNQWVQHDPSHPHPRDRSRYRWGCHWCYGNAIL